MAKLSLRTWIRNAAAVFSGDHGAVTRQAEQAECSRETAYQHARKLEQRLATEPTAGAVDELRAENRRLRQIEDLLGILLPTAEVPDHSTLGQWVGAEARRAGAVLAALDPACARRTRTLALDEIFFGGGRPW